MQTWAGSIVFTLSLDDKRGCPPGHSLSLAPIPLPQANCLHIDNRLIRSFHQCIGEFTHKSARLQSAVQTSNFHCRNRSRALQQSIFLLFCLDFPRFLLPNLPPNSLSPQSLTSPASHRHFFPNIFSDWSIRKSWKISNRLTTLRSLLGEIFLQFEKLFPIKMISAIDWNVSDLLPLVNRENVFRCIENQWVRIMFKFVRCF